MTITIEQKEVKPLVKTAFTGFIVLISGTLVTRKAIDWVIKKAATKNNKEES